MDIVFRVLWVAFWGLLFLSLLVVIHEAGHYFVARAFGVRVTEFYLGLPCRLRFFIKSRRHGTEFGVTPFLLGGYNRISGMNQVPEGDMARAFAIVQREGRVRATDLAAEMGIDEGDAYGLLGGLCDIVAIQPYYDPELGEHPMQRDYPEAFETLARDRNMATEYDSEHDFTAPGMTEAAEPRPLDDPASQLERERARTYQGLSFWKRLAVIFAGPAVNIILAFLIVCGTYMSIEYKVGTNANVIGEVYEDSLAEAAGLQAGDTVVEIAGTVTPDWVAVSNALDAARTAGTDFEVVYERDGELRRTTVDMPEGDQVELIGVMAQTEPYRLSFGEAVSATLEYASFVGTTVVKLLLPQHTMEVLENSSSVVGISVMVADAVETGLLDVLAVIAAISMSLGFMNLLPIPPLDGGKIMIEVVGILMRRPVPGRIALKLSYVGLAFFLFIFAIALKNDVMRFIVS